MGNGRSEIVGASVSEFTGSMDLLSRVLGRQASGLTIGEAAIIGTKANTALRILSGDLVVEDVKLQLATAEQNGGVK